MATKVKLLNDTVIIPSGSVATTQSASDNTTKLATTAYVTTAIANLADSAPSTLNTLNELAAALGDDANFSTTVTNSIAGKLPLAGGTLTGNLTVPYLATTSYIDLNNSGNRGKIGWSGNHTYIATSSSVGSIIFKNNVSSSAAPQTGGDTLLTLADGGDATFAGVITASRFIQNSNVASNLYAAEFSRSGTGTATPDIWGGNNTFVIGTSSSTEAVGFSGANAEFYGTISSGAITAKSDGGNDTINVVHSGNTVKLVALGQSSDNSGNGVIQLKRNNGVLHTQIHSHGSTYFDGGNVGIGFASGSPNAKLHVGSAAATGNGTNPAIQIGGTNTYRLGLYTNSEAGFIENKNGDDGLRFNVKTLGEVLRLTTDSRIITGDISVYTNEYSRNISINNVTDSSNNGFSEYVAWIGTNVRWDDSANTWKRATEDSNFNWGGISGIVYGSDSLKFVTAPYNNATGSGAESSIGSLPALVSMTLNSAGNLYLTGGNDRRIKLSDSGIAGVSDSNNTVHIRGDNDFVKINAAANGGIIFEENGVEHMRIKSGGNVGIGSNNPAALLEIAGSGDAIRVESENSGTSGAQLDLLHFSASPADGDIHGFINMGGYYSGTTSSYASSIRSKWKDVAARETELDFYMRTSKPNGFYRKVTMHSDSGVEIQAPNTSNAEGTTNTVIGFYHYYKTNPGANYAHMKTNFPTGGNTATFGMIAIEATGYKYNTGDVVKGMWGFHNWNSGSYSPVAANLISSSSNGFNFCHGTYVSSDGYIVLVANSGGSGSIYLGARLDFIDTQADYQKHGTAYWPPKVTAISWSNNSTGVY